MVISVGAIAKATSPQGLLPRMMAAGTEQATLPFLTFWAHFGFRVMGCLHWSGQGGGDGGGGLTCLAHAASFLSSKVPHTVSARMVPYEWLLVLVGMAIPFSTEAAYPDDAIALFVSIFIGAQVMQWLK